MEDKIMQLTNQYMEELLINSYRKLKSYVYYSSNNLFLKQQIVDFESTSIDFETKIRELSNSIMNVDNRKINYYISKIDFYILPKYPNKSRTDERIISSFDVDEIDKIRKLNFFIKCPIELLIIDTLWTVLIGRFYVENKNIAHLYANIYDRNLFSMDNNDFLESLNQKSLSIFEPYFKGYQNWKNDAVDKVVGLYNQNKDSILFSIDLTSYYYSINVDFDKIYQKLTSLNPSLKTQYDDLIIIQKIVEKIYFKYSTLISNYRKDIAGKVVLPIGLLSSCVLSNVYLIDFDDLVLKNKNVVHYGRYVDDIIIITNQTYKQSLDIDKHRSTLLYDTFPEFFIKKENHISLFQHESIIIQEEKVKIIAIAHQSSRAYIEQIKSNIGNASEPNLLPNIGVKLENFLSDVINKQNDFLKPREANHVDIDSRKLSRFIRIYLSKIKNTNESKSEIEVELRDQIVKLLTLPVLIQLYSKWETILQFALLSSKKIELFVSIHEKILYGIEKIIFELDDTFEKNREIELVIKTRNTLLVFLNFSLHQAIAIKQNTTVKRHFSKYQTNVNKIRKSNMFDHKLISLPMINYIKNRKLSNYFDIDYNYLQKKLPLVLDDVKIKYSPRFIHFDEYSVFYYYSKFDRLDDKNIFTEINIEYDKIYKIFNDNSYSTYDEKQVDLNPNYYLSKIKIQSTKKIKDLQKVYIALANMNLSSHKMIDHGKISFTQVDSRRKVTLFKLLNECNITKFSQKIDFIEQDRYHPNSEIVINTQETKVSVQFILFPEASIPFEWLPDIAYFSRKTNITIVFGMKYIKVGNRIINSVVTIIPSTNDRGYKSANIFIREKNDYSPEEKSLIEFNGLSCINPPKSKNHIFEWNNINFSVFNCYELTDITARSLMQGRIDLLLSTQYNKDVSYFSSIAESSAREIFCYLAQANTSEYGDTKIIAPMHLYYKSVAQISGGEKDSIHIGKINIDLLKLADSNNENTKFTKFKKSKEQKEKDLKNEFPIEFDLEKFASISARYTRKKS